MSDRPVDILIEDILESIQKITDYTDGHKAESFIADEMTADAVVRNLEIIGEAASRLPDDFTTRHSEIDWRKIVGLRNRIIHEYFGVDLEIVWQIIQQDLPELKEKLEQLPPE
ncbi:MAG: DUF86 domain-containing protein [Actinomycetota bacterium]